MVEGDKKSKKKTQGLRISSFISKLAKTVGENGLSIKGETLDIIQQLLVGLLDQIASNLNKTLAVPGSKKTVKAIQAKVATELTFGQEASNLTREVLDSSSKAMAAGKDHGLIFAVPRTSRYFRCQLMAYCDFSTKTSRRFRVTTRRLDKGLGVCITSILQEVCHQILTSASQRMEDGKRTRLTPRDLYLALKSNPDLAHIFREFVTQGGVEERPKGAKGEKGAKKAKEEGKKGAKGKKGKKAVGRPKGKKAKAEEEAPEEAEVEDLEEDLDDEVEAPKPKAKGRKPGTGAKAKGKPLAKAKGRKPGKAKGASAKAKSKK